MRNILKRKILHELMRLLLANRLIRSAAIKKLEALSWNYLVERNQGGYLKQIQVDKHYYFMALLHGFDRALRDGTSSPHVFRRFIQVFVENVIMKADRKEAVEKLGFVPPLFLLISPGGRCNLACKGCYAASHPGDLPSLDAETFNRILHEKQDLWGSYFTVISGGEPLLWQDGEWDILKIIEHHPTQLFLMYTNGTLITDEVARKMADLGNITPAISVEGFESQTDDRRGKGVFKKILTAFENLRRHGVPFGVSATPTRWNWDVITSDAFVDFYFEQQGALYAWLFQYMPIGRGHSTDMMVPPKDRVEMMHRMNRLIRERKAFMADFWNSGPVSRGCISAGRSYGYFYIDWNGDISPCSFVPYAAGNIHDIYASGGDLNTVLNLPFFKRIREWQNEYGYEKPNQEIGNWLCPCIMRDHFSRLKDIALETKAEPINKEAAEALHDMEYFKRMIEYDEEIDRLTRPIWTKEYLNRSETKENNSNIKVEQDPVTEMAHK